MYVIYINDRPLTLLSSSEHRTSDRGPSELAERTQSGTGNPTHLTALYNGKPRTLLQYADMLEKGSPKVQSVDLVAEDLEQLWLDFRGKYKWVPAAGGVVENTVLDKTLFIFRRGSWDLPKGKIDEGEEAPAAALREVKEETGLQQLQMGEALPTTYHTYRNQKNKRVLKPTYWYRMSTVEEGLIPEEGEGIEKAEWRNPESVLGMKGGFYCSLRQLFFSDQSGEGEMK